MSDSPTNDSAMRLYNQHRDWANVFCRKYAKGINNKHDREDFKQDVELTFYNCCVNWKPVEGKGKFFSYCWRAMRNTRKSFLDRLYQLPQSLPDGFDTPIEEVEEEEIPASIEPFLDCLTPKQKEVIERRVKGESVEEVADSLIMAVGTVRKHGERAYASIREFRNSMEAKA